MIETVTPVIEWTDEQLKEQFRLCNQWNDPDQWDALAHIFASRGYMMNAAYCWRGAGEAQGGY